MKAGTKEGILRQKHLILGFPGQLQPFQSVYSKAWSFAVFSESKRLSFTCQENELRLLWSSFWGSLWPLLLLFSTMVSWA